MSNILGCVLLIERRKAGITQKRTSELTGVPRTKISAYENGRQLPSGKNLDKLLELYGSTPGQISIIKTQWNELTQLNKNPWVQKMTRRQENAIKSSTAAENCTKQKRLDDSTDS